MAGRGKGGLQSPCLPRRQDGDEWASCHRPGPRPSRGFEQRGGDQLGPKPGKSLGDIFISMSQLVTQPALCFHSRGWSRLQKMVNDLKLTPLRPGSPRGVLLGPPPTDSWATVSSTVKRVTSTDVRAV